MPTIKPIPLPEIRNERIFNRGRDSFLGGGKNPYRRCRDYRRAEWQLGFDYQRRLYLQLLNEAEGNDYNL